MIKIEAITPHRLSPSGAKRARKMVREMLESTGGAGRSASGQTLAFAVEWCEEHKRPYRITAHPGLGYYLELLEPLS